MEKLKSLWMEAVKWRFYFIYVDSHDSASQLYDAHGKIV